MPVARVSRTRGPCRPVLEVYPAERPNGTIGVATRYTPESRPDFAIPIYAVAPEYQVPVDAPPLFVAVAFDDNERMTSTATTLVERWKTAKVPVELHVFPDGGHGFGMNKKGKSCDAWTDLLARWMQHLGLLSPGRLPSSS